jgi:hypothetical protein
MTAALKTVRIIQIGMLVSVLLCAAIGEFANSHIIADATLIRVISFASISVVGAILVVRKTLVLQSEEMLRDRPGDTVILGRWRSGYIVTYALCEALALFGLVLRIMGFTIAQVWPYYAGAFVLLLLFWPRAPKAVIG